ncbi:MAG: phosphate ABC transporter permease subunit PstC [Planctomycetota bacterium]|nr:phosphate ABC transporter permease subunit PstC [Planctomycetota bacterium]MEE2736760.1 phosphate ABC transporter permease subunit PstC [Planctomycetota bacterium]
MNRVKEQAIQLILLMCALLSIFTTVGIIYVLVSESIVGVGDNSAFFQEVSAKEFFTDTQWTPQFREKHYGVLPLLGGTLLIAGIAALIGLPVGLASAIYLSEYASPRTRNIIKPILEILAGIPTVVYGYFALVFITPYVLRPIFQDLMGFNVDVFNAASAGIVVGIMIIPMVSSLSEDTLRAVPRGLREASYALGSTKFDVSVKVVLPAAISGILASFLLAISRAVGETMAVTIAAGQTPALTMNPFRSVQTMTSYIVNVSLGDTPVGSMGYKSLYAIALTLFCITLVMNFLSQFIMRRYREVYE